MNIANDYIEAALWSSYDDEGEPLDRGDYELSQVAKATLEAQAIGFAQTYSELIELYLEETGRDESHVGHNFWLSRNGHGAGFFDDSKDDGDAADKLQIISQGYREVNLCVEGDMIEVE